MVHPPKLFSFRIFKVLGIPLGGPPFQAPNVLSLYGVGSVVSALSSFLNAIAVEGPSNCICLKFYDIFIYTPSYTKHFKLNRLYMNIYQP